MKVAFCFPGQGSQDVGMGRAMAEAFPEARAVYDEASEAVGFDLARLCFEGPIEELTRTELQQPALVATSLACLRAVETLGIAAGRTSSATRSASTRRSRLRGALSTARRSRSSASAARRRRARPTSTPARWPRSSGSRTRSSKSSAREIEDVWPANYNCPGQLVVSGENAAVDSCSRTRRRAARAAPSSFRSAGAFHSPLVGGPPTGCGRPSRRLVRRAAPPFMSTVTASLESAGADRRSPRSTSSPARSGSRRPWRRSSQEGVDTFVEIGPGQVLSGLVRRCDRSLRTFSVGDPDVARRSSRRSLPLPDGDFARSRARSRSSPAGRAESARPSAASSARPAPAWP